MFTIVNMSAAAPRMDRMVPNTVPWHLGFQGSSERA